MDWRLEKEGGVEGVPRSNTFNTHNPTLTARELAHS